MWGACVTKLSSVWLEMIHIAQNLQGNKQGFILFLILQVSQNQCRCAQKYKNANGYSHNRISIVFSIVHFDNYIQDGTRAHTPHSRSQTEILRSEYGDDLETLDTELFQSYDTQNCDCRVCES